MLFESRIREEFNIEPITAPETDAYIKRCMDIYTGHPDWINPNAGDIRTINFAKTVCSEVARLTTLAIGIKIDGGARAKWLQEQIDAVYFNLRHWVEYGAAAGTVVLKPNGTGIDCLTPDRFKITGEDSGEITGAVFIDQQYDAKQKKWYTRFEHHRFEGEGDARQYVISNRCFIGESKNDNGRPIDIKNTPWSGLEADVVAVNVDKPLFGVFRTPMANNMDINSPLGMPVFADAVEELADLDIAYSLNAVEIAQSKRTVLVDSDRVFVGGESIKSPTAFEARRKAYDLPDYIRIVQGNDEGDVYEEINPTLNTDTRLTGINAILSQIGYKCGFSDGYFVPDSKTGVVTATQVEADDRRTIQLIKDMRDKLEDCLDGLLYALDKFADAYGWAPVGTYKVQYAFGDITYSYEEDKSRWLSYANSGKIPFWYYLVKFENMTEADARALVEQAQPDDTLFGESE